MAYEIHDGLLPPLGKPTTKGRKPTYPLRELREGEWLAVAAEEWPRLQIAVRNARRNHGLPLQTQLSADGSHYIVWRVPSCGSAIV